MTLSVEFAASVATRRPQHDEQTAWPLHEKANQHLVATTTAAKPGEAPREIATRNKMGQLMVDDESGQNMAITAGGVADVGEVDAPQPMHAPNPLDPRRVDHGIA